MFPDLPYELSLTLGALQVLKSGVLHGEQTFAPKTRALFPRLHAILTDAGFDVPETIIRMQVGGFDVESLPTLDRAHADQLTVAFKDAGVTLPGVLGA